MSDTLGSCATPMGTKSLQCCLHTHIGTLTQESWDFKSYSVWEISFASFSMSWSELTKAMKTWNLLCLKNKQTKKWKQQHKTNPPPETKPKTNQPTKNKKRDLSVIASLWKQKLTNSTFIFTEQGNGSLFYIEYLTNQIRCSVWIFPPRLFHIKFSIGLQMSNTENITLPAVLLTNPSTILLFCKCSS